MKIKTVNAASKQPLVNTKLQLQVKGKDSGFLSVMTDQRGEFQLDDKYKGQYISALIGSGTPSPGITASDGGTLTVATTDKSKEMPKQKETWK